MTSAILFRLFCCPSHRTTARLCNLLTIKWHYIFFLLLRYVLSPITYKTFSRTMRVTRRVSFKKQEMQTLCKHVGLSPSHLFSVCCCVVFLCFVFLRPVSYVPNVASVSGFFILSCPFGYL